MLAGWVSVVTSQEPAFTTDRERRLAIAALRCALFDAAMVHYRDRTDNMDAAKAADWIQTRCDRLVAHWDQVGESP